MKVVKEKKKFLCEKSSNNFQQKLSETKKDFFGKFEDQKDLRDECNKANKVSELNFVLLLLCSMKNKLEEAEFFVSQADSSSLQVIFP